MRKDSRGSGVIDPKIIKNQTMKTTTFPIIKIYIRLVAALLTIVTITFIQSCKDEDEIVLGTTMLQGTWIEIEDPIQHDYTNRTFIFQEDSFFLRTELWSDIVYPEDTISGSSNNFYYYKGKYSFDANTITFEGKEGFDSNFAEPEDASRIRYFHAKFDYELKSLNTIVLNPEPEEQSITLVKE